MRTPLPIRFTDARTVAMVDPETRCAFGPVFDSEAEILSFPDRHSVHWSNYGGAA